MKKEEGIKQGYRGTIKKILHILLSTRSPVENLDNSFHFILDMSHLDITTKQITE